MFNKKKILIFAAIITHIPDLYAFPTRFTRMMLLKKDGSIEKTVDLIHEIHERYHEQICKPYEKQTGLITPEEKQAFTSPERTLLINLRKLAKTSPEKIDLLWEYSEDAGLPRECTFITYAGMQAKKEFTPDKKVVFQDIDTMRRPLRNEFGVMLHKAFDVARNYPLKDFNEKCENVKNELLKDLETAKKAKDHHRQIFLESLIGTLDTIANINKKLKGESGAPATLYDMMFEIAPILKMDPVIKDLITRITDYEIMRNILDQNAKHFVVYAGSIHSSEVSKQLEKYNYITMLDVGSPDYKGTNPPLSHAAWKFLLEAPEGSLKRYKEKGEWYGILKNKNAPFVHLASTKQIDEWYDLLKNVTQFGSDDAFLQKLEKFVNLGKENYINFLETRDEDGNTVLFKAAAANYLNGVTYLLKNHARVNAFNYKGETPLFASKLSKDMIQLLVKNGADLSILNKFIDDTVKIAPKREERLEVIEVDDEPEEPQEVKAVTEPKPSFSLLKPSFKLPTTVSSDTVSGNYPQAPSEDKKLALPEEPDLD